jgi:hypothetical protein
MRVESAQITLNAQHEELHRTLRQETLQARLGERASRGHGPPPPLSPDTLSLSPEARALQPVRGEVPLDGEEHLGPHDRLALDILRRFFKALTGREMQVFSPEELSRDMARVQNRSAEFTAQLETTRVSVDQAAAASGSGAGLAYDYYESHFEYEKVSFSAEGVIKTRDGREIRFSVRLDMSRTFYSEHRESLRLGDAAQKVDPLVVNFDGNAAELGDTRFAFDLDSDGRSEQLALLKPGSAFLALDKNGDGQINDGRELFGPTTGNGFRELAAYDEDGNGFIDAGDSVYDRLRLWLLGADGSRKLVGLGEKGIGAIFLGHLATPFQLRDAANDALGEVAASGVYFGEDGGSGTVQEVNYVL